MKKAFNPNRLKVARIANGLKQSDLALKLDVSRQYIHQIESGASIPNDDSVNAFCDLLGILPSYLYKDSPTQINSLECNFRKQKTTPKFVSEQIISKAIMFYEIFEWISDYIDLPEQNFPQFDIRNLNDIENAAEKCRIHWELGLDFPIENITRVAENAGALVMRLNNVHDQISALSVTTGRPIILHNGSNTPPSRLRYDIGHEIGHFIMHTGMLTGDSETEDQANYFSGAFLLPKNAFKKDFPQSSRIHWKTIFELKKKWNVSIQAIIRRAYNLSLLSPSQYKTASIYISKNGYRKKEPFEADFSEKQELIESCFTTLSEHFSIYAEDIRENTGIDIDLLENLTGLKLKRQPISSRNIIDVDFSKKQA